MQARSTPEGAGNGSRSGTDPQDVRDLWTVAWSERHPRQRGATLYWCATRDNALPDPRAILDRTACGYMNTLRIGSRRGEAPTCPDCLVALARGGQ